MNTFRVAGMLLLYPDQSLVASLPAMRQELARENLIPVSPLQPLFARLGGGDLLDLQEDYVGLFDRHASHSLHLYEHVWGDARERGEAMVRLQAVYALHGLSHVGSELPDYLPLFCEFLSLIPLPAAASMLSEAVPVLNTLHSRLERRKSPYAAVFSGLAGLAVRAPAADGRAPPIEENLPDEEGFAAMDRAWEEAMVTFGPSAGGGCAPETPASRNPAPLP